MQLIGPDGLRKVLHVTAGELSLVQQSQPGALGFWLMVYSIGSTGDSNDLECLLLLLLFSIIS